MDSCPKTVIVRQKPTSFAARNTGSLIVFILSIYLLQISISFPVCNNIRGSYPLFWFGFSYLLLLSPLCSHTEKSIKIWKKAELQHLFGQNGGSSEYFWGSQQTLLRWNEWKLKTMKKLNSTQPHKSTSTKKMKQEKRTAEELWNKPCVRITHFHLWYQFSRFIRSEDHPQYSVNPSTFLCSSVCTEANPRRSALVHISPSNQPIRPNYFFFFSYLSKPNKMSRQQSASAQLTVIPKSSKPQNNCLLAQVHIIWMHYWLFIACSQLGMWVLHGFFHVYRRLLWR